MTTYTFDEIEEFYKLKLEYDYLVHKNDEQKLLPSQQEHLKSLEEKFNTKKDELIQSGKLNILTAEQANELMNNIFKIEKVSSHKLDNESAKKFCEKYIVDNFHTDSILKECELVKLEDDNYYIKTPTGKLKPFNDLCEGTNGSDCKINPIQKQLHEGWKKIKEKTSKEADIRIRMSTDEKEKIQENAKKRGYTNVSEYIRDVAVEPIGVIYKYDLSDDKLGLRAYIRTDSDPTMVELYHINCDDMTTDQQIIHKLLLMNRVLSLELQGATK